MQAKFCYAIKFVADMDRAVAFYRDTFGLTVKFASPFWSEFETGEVTLALHPAGDRNPAGAVELGFSTDNLADLFARRAENGLSFSMDPHLEHGALLSQILDSEGVGLSLSGKP